MVDIRAELEKKILESNQRATSLSDRLTQLDEFNQNTAVPQISSQVPKGYNPMNSLQALFQMISNRKAVAGDVTAERDSETNLLSQLAAMQEQDRQYQLEQQKLNQPDAVDPLKVRQQLLDEQKAGVKWNPETGTFEPENAISQEKQQIISDIDEVLIRDIGAMTGLPNLLKTGQNITTKAKVEQIKSKLGLDERKKLKGSGQISDYEMKLLEKSVGALNYRMSDADFRTELEKIKGILSGEYDGSGEDYLDLVNKYWK